MSSCSESDSSNRVFCLCLSCLSLLTDLKGARHNGTPKPLRGEHKGPRGRGRIKPREEGKEDKRGGGGGGAEEEGGKSLARRQASRRAFG